MEYSAERDTFMYTHVVNVGEKKRGKSIEPDLTLEILSKFDITQLTRRKGLLVCNMWLDFLGHCMQITIRLKCAVKQLFAPIYSLKWDDPIPEQEYEVWLKLITMLVLAEPVTFVRTVNGETDEYTVVAYFDGSNNAFLCTLYILAKTPEKEFNRLRLLTNKVKVAPEWEVNTARMELSGAVLASRITLQAVNALHAGCFKEWYLNRIGVTHNDIQVLEETRAMHRGG